MNKLSSYIGAASLALATTTAYAVPVGSATMEELENGAVLVSGDKIFDDWEIFGILDPYWSDAVNLSNIVVNAIGDGTAGNAYGLEFLFGSEFNIGAGIPVEGPDLAGDYDSLDFAFGYSVEAAADWVINGVSLNADGSASGDDAFFTVQKDAYTDPNYSNSIWGTDGYLDVYDDTIWGTNLSDAGAIPDLNTLWVYDNILLLVDNYEDADGGSAELVSFEQRFTQTSVDVPVPATLALFALGLVGMAGARRRS